MRFTPKAPRPELQDWEGIIRPATEQYGNGLQKDRLARCCPLDKIPGDLEYPVSSSLGKLDILPLELRHAVFHHLDIQSLINLRRVSQMSRFAVDALPQYRFVQHHAPELLRAAIGLEISKSTLIADLFKTLTSQTCYLCGDFGTFIYLLSCHRVCLLCLTEETELRPLRVAQARDLYCLDEQALAALPKLRSLYGKHSQYDDHKYRLELVDRAAAVQAGIAVHGSFENVVKAFERHEAQMMFKYGEYYMADMWLDPRVHSPHRPYTDHDPLRFMGVIRVPWVDSVSTRQEIGVSCKGCARDDFYEYALERQFDHRRTYSQANFLEHLKECVKDPLERRWPKSLDSVQVRESSGGTICYRQNREAFDEVCLLDPSFVKEVKTLVTSLYSQIFNDSGR
ncbi:hypothetical protein G7Y79_00074g098750 [Physcia stellaris]|nr:hypothetical protein G7Y79_00074g098750 [Physcia stellaris]